MRWSAESRRDGTPTMNLESFAYIESKQQNNRTKHTFKFMNTQYVWIENGTRHNKYRKGKIWIQDTKWFSILFISWFDLFCFSLFLPLFITFYFYYDYYYYNFLFWTFFYCLYYSWYMHMYTYILLFLSLLLSFIDFHHMYFHFYSFVYFHHFDVDEEQSWSIYKYISIYVGGSR